MWLPNDRIRDASEAHKDGEEDLHIVPATTVWSSMLEPGLGALVEGQVALGSPVENDLVGVDVYLEEPVEFDSAHSLDSQFRCLDVLPV
jgi:hypothetical protein